MSGQTTTAGFIPWPKLSGAYFDPMENHEIARAQSLLTGGEIGVCPPLDIEQARDVIAWYDPKH
jgi:hypothetical protein